MKFPDLKGEVYEFELYNIVLIQDNRVLIRNKWIEFNIKLFIEEFYNELYNV